MKTRETFESRREENSGKPTWSPTNYCQSLSATFPPPPTPPPPPPPPPLLLTGSPLRTGRLVVDSREPVPSAVLARGSKRAHVPLCRFPSPSPSLYSLDTQGLLESNIHCPIKARFSTILTNPQILHMPKATGDWVI